MVEWLVAGICIGLALGVTIASLASFSKRSELVGEAQVAKARLSDLEQSKAALTERIIQASADINRLTDERARLSAQLAISNQEISERENRFNEDQARMTGIFAELSGQALRQNTEQFLILADTRLREAQELASGDLGRRQDAIVQLLTPIHENLTKYEESLRQLELERKSAYSSLIEKVSQLGQTQALLQRETRNLVSALRSPQTRGRWGEIQLRRVVEIAGMQPHCDFEEQVSVESSSGVQRPDMIIQMPGGGQVIVDSKVALDAFLSAVESDDDAVRKTHLIAHARQLRTHVDQLAKKQYWSQFEHAPDMVVSFIPGDALLAAAFEHDPSLYEYALRKKILLATPTTLIALLQTVAYTWQQESLTENAQAIRALGSELYDRLRGMGGHMVKLHRNLTGAVEAFNETVGSLESRVLVTARRFPDLGVVGSATKEIPSIDPIAVSPRYLRARDMPGIGGLENKNVHNMSSLQVPRQAVDVRSIDEGFEVSRSNESGDRSEFQTEEA